MRTMPVRKNKMHDHDYTFSFHETINPDNKEALEAEFGCECGEKLKVAPGSQLFLQLKEKYGARITSTKPKATGKRVASKKSGRGKRTVR